MIVSHTYNNKIYVLSNDDLKVGDEVYPISNGISDDKTFTYKHKEFDFREHMSGFPNEPHIIKDLKYSHYKPYEIHTSYGYGPVEKYFKIISINDVENINENNLFISQSKAEEI